MRTHGIGSVWRRLIDMVWANIPRALLWSRTLPAHGTPNLIWFSHCLFVCLFCLFVCLFILFSMQEAGERELYQQRVADLLKENEALRTKISELEAANKRLKTSFEMQIHKF